MYVFGGVKCGNECRMTAGDSEKKAMKSIHRRSQEESKKELKSREHVLENLHKPDIRLTLCTVLLFGLPLNQQC